MRFSRIRMKGIGPFAEQVELDVDALPGLLVAITGPNGSGKCLPAHARVYDPEIGAIPIADFVAQRRETVIGYSEGREKIVPVSDWIACGDREVLRISARGWNIDAAATHPILTARGYVRAGELRADDHIAMARQLPVAGTVTMTEDEARLVGYLVADGTLGSGVTLSASLDWKVAEYERCLRSVFPGAVVSAAHRRVDVLRGEGSEARNLELAASLARQGIRLRDFLGDNTPRFLEGGAMLAAETVDALERAGADLSDFRDYLLGARELDRWVNAMGLKGLAAEKTLGLAASISQELVGALLGALWFADGYVSATAMEVSYTTASTALSVAIRDLLMRVGILSMRHVKRVDGKLYFTVVIPAAHVRRFEEVTRLRGPKGERLRGAPVERGTSTNVDSIPFDMWSTHHLKDVGAWRQNRSGMSREKFLAAGGPVSVAESEIWYVPITDIASVGAMPCFDLTVATSEHAYVADGFIVHNSTLLEGFPGAMYRTTPTHGTIADLATTRDAYIEAEVVNGARHRIRQTIDAISKKGESLVLDDAGAPLVQSGKRKEFDAWATKHLPAAEVLFTSSFAPQRSEGFSGLTEGDRKAVLLRELGHERLEQLAERARKRATEKKAALATAVTRIEDERTRLGGDTDVGAIEAKLVAARAEAEEASATVERAKAELAKLAIADQEQRAAERAYEEALQAEGRLDAQVRELTARLGDLDRRIANNRAVLTDGDRIREAARRGAEIDGAAKSLDATIAAIRAQVAIALAAIGTAEREQQQAREREKRAQERIARAEATLGSRSAMDLAKASLPDLQTAFDDAQAKVEACEKALEAARGVQIAGADQRIGWLREGLGQIAETFEYPDAIARRTLKRDDEAVDAGKNAPSGAAEAQTALKRAQADLATRRSALQQAKDAAAWDRLMGPAEADRAEAVKERDVALAAEGVAQRALRQATSERDVARQEEADRTAMLRALENESEGLKADIARVAPLTAAEGRLAELEPQVAAAREALERASEERGALVRPAMAPARVDFAPTQRVIDTSEAVRRGAEARAAVLDAQRASVKAASERLEALRREREALEEELSDWQILADSLGRDGLQAMEIDAAGPELTALVNELLHTCVGPRWTVSIETVRASADGKRQLEGCDVRVIDTKTGRDADVKAFSPGEGVLLGEAISLALTVHRCRETGAAEPTIVRDESGAALDPVAARAYVAMLRHAASIVGASKVLLVSHSKEVWALCDSRVIVKDGKVAVAPVDFDAVSFPEAAE